VNGEAFDIAAHLEEGYVRLEREWKADDRVELEMAMPVERMYAHPDVRQDAGCVALQHGPLVYCLEAADNNLPLHRIAVPKTAELASHFEPDVLGGVTVVHGNVLMQDNADWTETLYRSWPALLHASAITTIPYYAWDNRQPGEMLVWLREDGS
jgi:DUF1680 family protein